MKIISIPSYEGADENHRTYLLEVERLRDGAKSKSWLNLNRLIDRSFVDQKYPDDFREEMATKFNSHYERLCHLRGGKIISESTTEVQRYKFGTDRAIVLDDEGNRVLDTPGTVTTVTFEAKKAAKANA
jgi:inactivated superfamily I helicase